MKKLFFISQAVLMILGCNAQQDKTQPNLSDQKNMPNTEWKVDKQVDENGNVTRYDSSYVWSYSSDGSLDQIQIDSLMKQLGGGFDDHAFSFFGNGFGGLNLNDSLMLKNLMSPDFFGNQLGSNFFDMDQMFKEMEKMHQDFFNQSRPPVPQPAPPTQQKKPKINEDGTIEL